MSVLIDTYLLEFDDLVEAEVEAQNEYGFGPLSPASSDGTKI